MYSQTEESKCKLHTATLLTPQRKIWEHLSSDYIKDFAVLFVVNMLCFPTQTPSRIVVLA